MNKALYLSTGARAAFTAFRGSLLKERHAQAHRSTDLDAVAGTRPEVPTSTCEQFVEKKSQKLHRNRRNSGDSVPSQ